VAQDRLLQPLKRLAGFDSQLVDQPVPGSLVCVERVRLAVGAVEGEHLLCAQALPERMLLYEHLELAENKLVATLGEIAVDPVHEHGQSQLVELRHLVSPERLENQTGERGAAPEGERLPQQE